MQGRHELRVCTKLEFKQIAFGNKLEYNNNHNNNTAQNITNSNNNTNMPSLTTPRKKTSAPHGGISKWLDPP
jgi:hypothetical protein